ncbi:hypothetical protein V6N13_061200 [Hibiscus sabdariffa]
MPTKGKREPSCKSIEGSPTLAGAHSAKVSTKILWLRAGSRLVTPDFSDKNRMGLQAYKILVKKNWIKLSRCSRTELALYSARSLGNHDASSATPTAAAIDQGLNKSSGEPTGCPRGSRPFSNKLLRMTIAILLSVSAIGCHRKFIRSMDRAKSGVLVRASRPILLPDIIGRSSSETRARNALFHFVPVLHFLLLESKGDFSYLESFCGVLRLLFFRTFFFLPRDRSAKHELARRRKGQTLRPNGGACVGDMPPEIELEALALPTSRQLMAMAIGHDYYQKAPMKMNISHGGVCICMLGVLLSCDPAAYVRPVAHASYLFQGGRREL